MILRWASSLVGVLLALSLLGLSSVSWAQARIEVEEPLKSELNALLKAADELHQVLFDRPEEHELRMALENLEQALNRAQRVSGVGGIQQRVHVDGILGSIRTHLEMAQVREGNERLRHLRELFRGIVQIARSFDVDRYRIFFCDRDRSEWIQSGWQVRNPFEPRRGGGCGKLAR